MDAHSIYKQEQEIIEKLKLQFPEKFIPKKQQDRELLEYIHAQDPRVQLPRAFLKYSPFDFIVEEIGSDNQIVKIDQEINTEVTRDSESTGTVYATLIKIGISTIEAVYQLRDTLGCDEQQIQYGGIKDAGSLTSQKISFRGVSADRIKEINLPNLILTNITEGKGTMTVGGIIGNLFTILLRTEHPVDQDAMLQKITDSQINGVLNFYGTQRFGSPRYLSHIFGRYLAQGDLQGLLQSIFFEVSDFEWPYISEIRRRASELWGQWNDIIEIFNELPYTFRMELKLVQGLIDNSGREDQYKRTLTLISDQLDFWIKSYGSYYTNSIMLDSMVQRNNLPEKLPLLASHHPDIMRFYGTFLKNDGTINYVNNLKQFHFIKFSPRAELETRIFPVWHGFKVVPFGVILSFELPKGAYATTLLNQMFEIVSGTVPQWVDRELIDTKQTLERGSTQALYEKFQNVLPKYLFE